MKLVEFKDGSFGIRKYNLVAFRYEYYDFTSSRPFFHALPDYHEDVRTTLDNAMKHFFRLTDKGKVADKGKVVL